MMPWMVALASTAICLFLWFQNVRRIMRERKSMVESALSQLTANRKRVAEAGYDPQAEQVLMRSESIYEQAAELYHRSLHRPLVRLPAHLMGFYPISQEDWEPEIDRSEPEQPVQDDAPRYFGSVRFFKNMILLAVIVMIATPTVACICLSGSVRDVEHSLEEKEGLVTVLQAKVEDLTRAAEKAVQREDAADVPDESDPAPAATPDQEQLIEHQQPPTPEKPPIESPYSELYPDFYAPQELNAAVKESKVMYLTFDDGPSVRTTEVLDILKEKDVKATFFVVGSKDEESRAILRRIVEEGHTLAMHSYSHSYSKIYASVEDYLADMYQIFTQIREETGVTPTLFRFPGGSINGYNCGIYQELIAEMMRRGFVPFDWNLSSADASEKLVPAETLVTNVVGSAGNVDRGVVLMHDSLPRTTTVQALAPMIDRLREMGFELKALTPEIKPMLYAYRE